MSAETRERWYQNGFNTCEVIIIRNGPDAEGHEYLDGCHKVHVAYYETSKAAAMACDEHNTRMMS